MNIPDPKVPDKIDPQTAAILITILLAGGLTFLGDRRLFIQEPASWIDRWISLPVLAAFQLTGDRLASDAAAFVFYAFLATAFGTALVRAYIRRVLKPRMVREMIEDQKLHKKILNENGANEVI